MLMGYASVGKDVRRIELRHVREQATYNLKGMINHHGSTLHRGHFTAVLHVKGSVVRGATTDQASARWGWFMMNDDAQVR